MHYYMIDPIQFSHPMCLQRITHIMRSTRTGPDGPLPQLPATPELASRGRLGPTPSSPSLPSRGRPSRLQDGHWQGRRIYVQSLSAMDTLAGSLTVPLPPARHISYVLVTCHRWPRPGDDGESQWRSSNLPTTTSPSPHISGTAPSPVAIEDLAGSSDAGWCH
jgi:hypothetical protein